MIPVSEPLLEFIVEVSSGGGAVGRWYAALLDPPGYAENTIVRPREENATAPSGRSYVDREVWSVV